MKKVMTVLLPLASLLVLVVTWNSSVQERGEAAACLISTFFVLLDIVITNTLYLDGLGLG